MGQLSVLAAICFVSMLSPGPDFVLVTKNALTLPRKQALATSLGIISGCLAHATYCVFGLAVIITKSILLFSVLKLAGACYLVYLGVQCLRSQHDSNPADAVPETDARTVPQAYLQGLLCNLLNPKLAVFLLSLFTQFLSVEASREEKIAVAGIFVLEAALYWPLLVFFLQHPEIRSVFARSRTVIDRVCGVLLIGLGLKVAFQRG